MVILDPDAVGQYLLDNAEREADGDNRDFLVVGLGRTEGFPDGIPAAGTKVTSIEEVAAANVDRIAVLSPAVRELWAEAAEYILAEFSGGRSTVVFLLPWRPAPFSNMRNDGVAYSFVCTVDVFRAILQYYPGCKLHKLCFRLLAAIGNGSLEVDRILVRQLPHQKLSCAAPPPDGAVIMAHRGKRVHLETALHYLRKTAGMKLSVRVGLDVDDQGEYECLVDRFPEVEFYYAQPAPVGPYVIRHELAARSREPVIVFHDSDDISCADRLETLYAAMLGTECDLIGSHELKVDEINESVGCFRFPLDVTHALNNDVGHPLQHPTSIMKRDCFQEVGGFSTDQRVANDSQFLLRAFFNTRIRNVDAIVYIRRRHPQALTVAPETGMQIPLRRRLGASWANDFKAIRNGQLKLEESSLRCIVGSGTYTFQKLRT
jgi:hypothetical protein